MKILIAEDMSDDRRLLRMNLEHHGCEVIEAKDGDEGLRLSLEHMPDMIISDGLMPNADGFQFLRGVKKDERLRQIPFIFYSATYIGHKEVELALSLGAERFILKPKEPEEFWEEILECAERCRLKGPVTHASITIEDEEYATRYSKIVAEKLEKKVKELEEARDFIFESEKKYRSLFEASLDGIYQSDADNVFTLINQAGAEIFGYEKPAEIIGRSVIDFWGSPEDRDRFIVRLKKVKYLRAYPVAARKRNGETVHIEVSSRILEDARGNFLGVEGIIRDVTETKKLEIERDRLFNLSVDMLCIAGFDGYFKQLNPAWEKTLGWTREELLASPYLEFVHADDRKATIEADRGLSKGRAVMGFENRYLCRDGSYRCISWNSFPLLPDNLIFAVARDITDHKRLEEQLLQVQKMEAVGTLAGGVAHDFNNVLNAVVGFAGLLQMKMDKADPLKHYADEIMAAGQRGAMLTHQILAFSRKQVLDMKPADLNEIVRSLEKMLRRLVREDISIELRLSDRKLVVMADPSQIDQVVINLATNARDAMPVGGRLTISTEYLDIDEENAGKHGYGSAGKYAILMVSDTGCGMDASTRSRIFEPFFTTKEVGKGTGLGLSVVHGIVRQHNGYIDVDSELGQGTVFKIYLPLTEDIAAETRVSQESPAIGGTETVLIAEDDNALRKLSMTVLQQYGYEVIGAVDGVDAITKFIENKDRIKLIILDGIMPKKNGKEAFDEIRRIRSDMKVIFMSGYSEDIFGVKNLSESGITCLLKPVTPSVLLKTVRDELDRP